MQGFGEPPEPRHPGDLAPQLRALRARAHKNRA
jgi:hypothetical protein